LWISFSVRAALAGTNGMAFVPHWVQQTYTMQYVCFPFALIHYAVSDVYDIKIYSRVIFAQKMRKDFVANH
jgi:hypothetical protein